MPVLTVYPHGGKGGVAPMKNSHQRAIRGDVQGWSVGATRRNTEFLMSVITPKLTGFGVALTLTLLDCPPTPDEWHRLRKAWTERMRYAGMVRLHWVTEWQRRGVPHLHCALWWPDLYDFATPIAAWLDLAGPYGAGMKGQHGAVMDAAEGWFQYVSKHASRGVKHYQRSADNVPAAWQTRTGRVWGKSGDWPLQDKLRFNLQDQHGDGGWFAYRRMIRAWRRADARSKCDRHRIISARRMLKCSDQGRSRVIGYSEWIPFEVQMGMIAGLRVRGYNVTYDV